MKYIILLQKNEYLKKIFPLGIQNLSTNVKILKSLPWQLFAIRSINVSFKDIKQLSYSQPC